MSIRYVWKCLVAAGTILMWIAFGMETSIESGSQRIHNLSLQSQQHTVLLLGGILFVAGIIIFAVVKLKQTEEEERQQRQESDARKKQAKTIAAVATGAAASQMANAGKAASSLFITRNDNLIGRLGVALFVCVCFAPFGAFDFGAWFLPSALVVLYALRNRPANHVMSAMLQMNTLYTFVLGFILAAMVVTMFKDLEFGLYWALPLLFTVLAFVPVGASFMILRHLRRKFASQPSH